MKATAGGQRIVLSLGVALLAGVGCQSADGGNHAESSPPVEHLVHERSGKTPAEHDEFAPYALHDRDGDGKLSPEEQAEAARAGLPVERLGDVHKDRGRR